MNDKKSFGVIPETTKHILLTTQKALKWLEYTLSKYAYDSYFWQQTTAKIQQIKANEQADRTYIENVHTYQRHLKSSHFKYHFQND